MTGKFTLYASVAVVASMLVGGLLVAGAGDTALSRPGPGLPADRAGNPGPDPAQVAAELARLQADIARLESATGNRLQELEIRGLTLHRDPRAARPATELPAATPDQATDRRERSARDDDDANSSAAAAARLDLTGVARVQQVLDNHLSGETYDARWAPEAQHALTGTLQQAAFSGSRLVDIDCRATLCRMGVNHDNIDAEREFLHRFIGSAGLHDSEAFYQRDEGPDGTVRMTFYLSRDGQRLPPLALSE